MTQKTALSGSVRQLGKAKKSTSTKEISNLAQENSFQVITYLNQNTIWCRTIVQQLIQYGANYAVLCIGGRSAALAMVLSTEPKMTTVIYNDERAAAFHALGRAKISKKPVIICTTSGSAVANLIPALSEAAAAKVPLIILTCDRPVSIRKSGAPQCTDHIEICRPLVCASIDLCDPHISMLNLTKLKRDITTFINNGGQPHYRAPIHINIPQLGQLTSTDKELDELPYIDPLFFKQQYNQSKSIDHIPPTPVQNDLALTSIINLKNCGIIFVGPQPGISGKQLDILARQTDFVVMADAPSGMRRSHSIQNLITTSDILLMNSSILEKKPDIVIRIGEAPVSHYVQQYLQAQPCPVIIVNEENRDDDFLSIHADTVITTNIEELINARQNKINTNPNWIQFWLSKDKLAHSFIEQYHIDLPWSECKAAREICNFEGFSLFHTANSMSIRHANLYCKTSNKPQKFLVNRGVSGIDGTISTFLGALDGHSGHGLLLLGDQAAAHDIGALQHALCHQVKGTVCIMNNGGSAIFDLLSCSSLTNYEQVIRNKPNIDFSKIVTAFGLPYVKCLNEKDLVRELNNNLNYNSLSVIEVCVPPESLKTDLAFFYITWRLTNG